MRPLLFLPLLLLLVATHDSTAHAHVLIAVGKRATQDGSALLAQTLVDARGSRARLERVDPTVRGDTQRARDARSADALPRVGYLSIGAHALVNEQQLSIVHSCTRHTSMIATPQTTTAAADRMTTSDFARSALAHCTSATCAVEHIKALADAHTLDCDGDDGHHRASPLVAGAMAIADKLGDVWIVHISRASEGRAERLADDHVAVVSPMTSSRSDDEVDAERYRVWRKLQAFVALPDARDNNSRCSAQSLQVKMRMRIEDVMHVVHTSAARDSDPLLTHALVLQTRSGVPDALGGVLWSTASASPNVFLPLSCAQQHLPSDATGRRNVQQALAAADSAVTNDAATTTPRATQQQQLDALQREAITLHARFVRELSRLGDSRAIARIVEWDLNAFAARAMAQQQQLMATARPTTRGAYVVSVLLAMAVALATLALGALWHTQRRRRRGYVRVSTEVSA